MDNNLAGFLCVASGCINIPFVIDGSMINIIALSICWFIAFAIFVWG